MSYFRIGLFLVIHSCIFSFHGCKTSNSDSSSKVKAISEVDRTEKGITVIDTIQISSDVNESVKTHLLRVFDKKATRDQVFLKVSEGLSPFWFGGMKQNSNVVSGCVEYCAIVTINDIIPGDSHYDIRGSLQINKGVTPYAVFTGNAPVRKDLEEADIRRSVGTPDLCLRWGR